MTEDKCFFCTDPATHTDHQGDGTCDRCKAIFTSDACGLCGGGEPIQMRGQWPACSLCAQAVREVRIGPGAWAIYDAADADLIEPHIWHTSLASADARQTYAKTKLAGRQVYMHRLLLGAGPNWEVDHINGDGLDNRRSNIRLATHAENQHNQPPRSKTGFKGVVQRGPSSFAAYISSDDRTRYLGAFATARDAAMAYDDAAIALYGDRARLNFPTESLSIKRRLERAAREAGMDAEAIWSMPLTDFLRSVLEARCLKLGLIKARNVDVTMQVVANEVGR